MGIIMMGFIIALVAFLHGHAVGSTPDRHAVMKRPEPRKKVKHATAKKTD